MFSRQISLFLARGLIPMAEAAAEFDPARISAADYADLSVGDDIQPAIVKAQVLLDRANISPGEIDGKYSARLDEDITAFAEAYGLPADTGWGRSFWLALTSNV